MDLPAFVVRPNEYGPLPFDAPHRFLVYGQIKMRSDINISPALEIRSGFPYSIVNEQLDFLGMRNQAGRFPSFVSLEGGHVAAPIERDELGDRMAVASVGDGGREIVFKSGGHAVHRPGGRIFSRLILTGGGLRQIGQQLYLAATARHRIEHQSR